MKKDTLLGESPEVTGQAGMTDLITRTSAIRYLLYYKSRPTLTESSSNKAFLNPNFSAL